MKKKILQRKKSNKLRKKLSLRKLVARITEKNRHKEIYFGGPVGREVW